MTYARFAAVTPETGAVVGYCRATTPPRAARLVEQHRDLRVLDHERQPLRRIARVERHVRAARLEDPQQADHHFQRPLDADADAHFGAHAQRLQVMRELIAALVRARRYVSDASAEFDRRSHPASSAPAPRTARGCTPRAGTPPPCRCARAPTPAAPRRRAAAAPTPRRSGSSAIPSSIRVKCCAIRSTVAASNNSLAYSNRPVSSSPRSSIASVTSNFAVVVSSGSPSNVSPASANASTRAFCRTNITWNSGVAAQIPCRRPARRPAARTAPPGAHSRRAPLFARAPGARRSSGCPPRLPAAPAC